MGVYDIYGEIQLKTGPCEMRNYSIGDKVPIPDGIYVGYGGAVVIKDGKFIAEFGHLTDKWGGNIEARDIIEPNNPVKKAIEKG